MMKTDFRIENPKDIELTMTVTMKLSEWNALADQLDNRYPSWLLAASISRMVREASKHFTSEHTADKE